MRDPTGKERRYVVTNVSSENRELEDRVGWGSERGSGHVRLTSSNGAAIREFSHVLTIREVDVGSEAEPSGE